ncbi:gas vesicle protein GvpO, halophile-type [Halegenticoccus soli]|uniref:gas vesicle protein GvpO, halophile-type n=1 Tax=Halegenticoccus soli TaxID=1985678 RepID=UPI000C6CA3D5|nr:gas vesicle protein GvpO [Halegenticoccus soli]
MSEAESETADDRCRALTEDGTRCARPAQEDGFCYQHDESDPTADESDADASAAGDGDASGDDEGASADDDEGASAGGDEDDKAAEGESSEGRDGVSDEAESTTDMSEESTEEGESDAESESEAENESSAESGANPDLMTVRDTVFDLAADVIGRDLDGITEVTKDDDGWRAVVEVVERRSVPDTQDILGRYEIELDEGGDIHGYRRLDRYRRSDTAADEF